MKKYISIIFMLFSFSAIAQKNLIYEAAKKHTIKMGEYEYILEYEKDYFPEGKEISFSEVLIKGNRKQYLGHFVYQLKSSTEMRISEAHPPYPQIENKILQSSSSDFNIEKEQIIVTTFYYDEKEPKEKEIKTLQQGQKGFFYVKERQIFFKNGKMKEEKNLPEKIEFYKVPF